MSYLGGNSAPYRLGSCGVGTVCFTGPMYNHGRGESAAGYVYDSTVTSYTSGSTTVGPQPYERWQVTSAGDNCELSSNCTGDYQTIFDGGCPGWYGTPLDGDTYQLFNLANPQPVHFSATGSNLNFSVCRKRGNKTVAARSFWHGRWPYNYAEGISDVFTLCSDEDGICSYDSYESLKSSVPGTKYLSLAIVATDVLESTCDDGPSPYSHGFNKTISVAANSGVLTVSCSGDMGGDTPTLIGWGDRDLSAGAAFVGFTTSYDPTLYTITCGATSGSVVQISNGNTIEEWGADFAGGNFYRNTYGQVNNSCNFDTTIEPGDTSWGVLVAETLSISATVLHYKIVTKANEVDPMSTHTEEVVCTLSDTNTAANVYADHVALQNEWNLADDSQYPWRTDGLPQICPLVSRNTVARNVSPAASTSCFEEDGVTPWTDPAAALNDGSILGAPQPAGYQNFWDPRYPDVRFCCNDPDSGCTNCADSYVFGAGGINGLPATAGQANNFYGTQLPLNATQWIDLATAVTFRPQAFISYADQSAYTFDCAGDFYGNQPLISVKYAAAKEMFPSQNLARPGDADRFAYVESNSAGVGLVYAATNVSGSGSGSVWSLLDYNGFAPGSLDTSGYWGGAVVGGFYAVTGYSGGNVTLGAKKFNLPSSWASQSGDDSVCFGQLRWPSAPGIIGRVAVTAVTDDGTLRHLTVTSSPNLGMDLTSAEKIKICAADMTVLADNVTVTRVSDTEFTVTTVLSAIAGAAFITPYLLADGVTPGDHYWWNDQNPKQQFVTLEWLSDFRTPAEATRCNAIVACGSHVYSLTVPPNTIGTFSKTQQCLPFTSCHPSVVCFSPNGETFPNGVTIPFPATFALDERYGSLWQGEAVFASGDPLWQKPHTPVDSPGAVFSWTMDGGGCNENSDTAKYFAHVPLVEPLLALPTNGGPAGTETAPALPGGVSFGFIDPTVDSTNGIYPLAAIGVSFTGGTLNSVSDERTFLMLVESTACASCPFPYQTQYNITCA